MPFVSIDVDGLTSKASTYAKNAAEAKGSMKEYKSVADAFKTGFNTFDAFGSGWASDAYKSGYNFGKISVFIYIVGQKHTSFCPEICYYSK